MRRVALARRSGGAIVVALLLGLAATCAPASRPDRSASPSIRATPDPAQAGETLGCLRTFLVLPAARCLDH